MMYLKHKTMGWKPYGELYIYRPTAVINAKYLQDCGTRVKVKKVKLK